MTRTLLLDDPLQNFSNLLEFFGELIYLRKRFTTQILLKMTKQRHNSLQFFGTVFIKSSSVRENSSSQMTRALSDLSIDENDVIEICSNLDVDKSKGPDCLPPILFRATSINIAYSLSQIYRKLLQTSIFPTSWKTAIGSPIFKKGNRSKVENYRPVSLLSIPSKISERILFRRLYNFFELILDVSQYGFRKKKSTILQLLTFFDEVHKSFDDDKKIEIIFTDFSKAFDRVDHGLLLSKLKTFGVQGKVLYVLKTYLMGRTQIVKVNNATSKAMTVTSGVPQGSVLGPLLFWVYINSFPEWWHSVGPLLFADDAMFISIGSSQETVQKELNAIYNCTVENKLPFNIDKCTHMEIGKDSTDYYVDDTALPKTTSHADLGLTLTEDLQWNNHIDKNTLKAMRVSHMIRRNISKLGWKAKLYL